MPLTPAGLAAAITTAQGPAVDGSVQASANMALATAIIQYLIANTVVTVISPSEGPLTGTID